MVAKGSLVVGELIRALSLCLKLRHVSPLTHLHIEGEKNAMPDIPVLLIRKCKKWYCKNNNKFLTLFNSYFPLPNQNSWTVFRLSTKASTSVISVLRMQAFMLDAWRRLPRPDRHAGKTGAPTSNLFKWTLSFRMSATPLESDASQALPPKSGAEGMVRAERSRVTLWRWRYQPHSMPLNSFSVSTMASSSILVTQ
jgi:hypothetical protein